MGILLTLILVQNLNSQLEAISVINTFTSVAPELLPLHRWDKSYCRDLPESNNFLPDHVTSTLLYQSLRLQLEILLLRQYGLSSGQVKTLCSVSTCAI